MAHLFCFLAQNSDGRLCTALALGLGVRSTLAKTSGNRSLLALLVTAGVMASCTELRSPGLASSSDLGPETAVARNAACIGCHGDLEGPAPTDVLHRAHLMGVAGFPTVACETCHRVPTSPSERGHADSPRPAEVSLSGAALIPGGPAATYDPVTRACSDVACHGARKEGPFPGATTPTPVWNPLAPVKVACGSCHGAPPGGAHPATGSCDTCHGPQRAERHGNGTIDLALPTGCSGCHGNASSPAPTDPTHRAHVLGTGRSKPVDCATCHPVPATVAEVGHLHSGPARVTFGVAAGPNARYEAGSCSGVSCHGASPTPLAWKGTVGPLSCTTCHTAPPAAPHPQVGACHQCHAPVHTQAGIAVPSRHIDGVVDSQLPTTCSACHGTGGDSGAPLDGGHTTHLDSTMASIPCATCHLVPAAVLSPGHVDTPAPVELTFAGKAVIGDATPDWTAGKCSGTACHGPAQPAWASAKGPGAACDSCHGAPPGGAHPQSDRCDVCHAPVAGSGLTGPTISAAGRVLHLDGQVQVVAKPSCSACHGDASSPAPATGAHAAHLSFGVPCETCHVVPATVLAQGHLDSPAPAELTFSGLALHKASSPTWSPTARTCSGTYCHGSATLGGTLTTPQWDATDGAAKACGACHGSPPTTHPPVGDFPCGACHDTGPGRHLNGTVDFKGP